MSIEKMLNLFFNIVALKQICVYHALLLAARAFNVWRKKTLTMCYLYEKKTYNFDKMSHMNLGNPHLLGTGSSFPRVLNYSV